MNEEVLRKYLERNYVRWTGPERRPKGKHHNYKRITKNKTKRNISNKNHEQNKMEDLILKELSKRVD